MRLSTASSCSTGAATQMRCLARHCAINRARSKEPSIQRLLQLDGHLQPLALAQHRHDDGLAGSLAFDVTEQVVARPNSLAVHSDDDIGLGAIDAAELETAAALDVDLWPAQAGLVG